MTAAATTAPGTTRRAPLPLLPEAEAVEPLPEAVPEALPEWEAPELEAPEPDAAPPVAELTSEATLEVREEMEAATPPADEVAAPLAAVSVMAPPEVSPAAAVVVASAPEAVSEPEPAMEDPLASATVESVAATAVVSAPEAGMDIDMDESWA